MALWNFNRLRHRYRAGGCNLALLSGPLLALSDHRGLCWRSPIIAAMAPKAKKAAPTQQPPSPPQQPPSAWPEAPKAAQAPPREQDPEILARLANPSEYGGVLVAAVFIVTRLLASKLASKIVLAPSQLGVHPCNRSSYGINEDAVHKLGKNIMDLGFCMDEITNPWCVQEDPHDLYITRSNEYLTESSDMIAKVTDPIVAGTLTNSHVTLLLRCILAGVPTEQSSLAVNGKMSLAHIEEQSPAMAHAALNGWQWTMIHHEVRHIYGDALFTFLSEVKNMSISAKEREIEVLLKISKVALKFKSETGSIPWDKVHEKILQTKPECADYTHSLINWVKEYSGGDNAHFVQDFAKFHAKYVPGDRVIGGAFWEHLAKLQIRNKQKTELRAPLLKYAILKCQSGCPPSAVQNRECKFISTADLDKMARTKYEECMAAEGLLQKARQVVLSGQTPLPEAERVKAFGRLDVSIARILLGKQRDSQVAFQHIEEPAFLFFEEVQKAAGLTEPNPWSAHAPQNKKKGGQQVVSVEQTGLQNYDCTGQHIPNDIQAELRAKGFTLNVKVVPKKGKDPDQSMIEEIATQVTLRHSDGSKSEITKEVLLQKYSLYKEEIYPIGAGHTAHSHEVYNRQSYKNIVSTAMYALTNASDTPALQIFAKPIKKVVSDDKYKLHELVLVPAALAVSSGKASEMPASACVVTTNIQTDSSTAFWLNAPPVSTDAGKKSLVSPFWLVPRTSQSDKVSMEMHKVSVKVSMDVGKNTTTSEHKVDFEILRNSKPIKKGDELFLQEKEITQQHKKQRQS